MKHLKIRQLVNLLIIIFITACGQSQPQAQSKVEETEKTAETLKIIEPTIGYTPDISEDAKKNLQRLKEVFRIADSIINTYPDYETAKQHLTKRQIEIWENEEEYSKEDHLDVGNWGCSWYCGGGPENIFASSKLLPTKKLDYKADNIHDFSLRTAWVEGATGYGIGESITFQFAKKSPPITTVKIYNGYMKSEKVWKDNSRVKQLKLYINDKPYALLNLKDILSEQIFDIGSQQGLEDDLYLKFEITEVYKGDKYDDVAISELEFDGTGVHCFAKGTIISTPKGPINIESLKVGDEVLSFNQETKKIESATILELASQKHHNLFELDFSGTKIIVTEDHPFFFDGQFYSIVENNLYGLQTQRLQKGQVIQFLENQKLKALKLSKITQLNRCELTYTITKLDRNKIFFANGAFVAKEEVAPEI